MNFKRAQWLAIVTLFVPCLAAAQQPGNTPDGSAIIQRQATSPSKTMDEDVEIMRRLLETQLGGIYGITPSGSFAFWNGYDLNNRINVNQAFNNPITNVPFDSWVRSHLGNTAVNDPFAVWQANLRAGVHAGDLRHGFVFPAAEGVYLPGYGVVYAMTLPPPSQPAATEPVKPAGKPLSDWERIRRELRGEKGEPASPAERQPPSVSGTIMRVLADNGRHLTALKDDEVITVAITFRHNWHQWNNQCATCHVVPGQAGGRPAAPASTSGETQGLLAGEGGATSGRASANAGNEAATGPFGRGDWSKVEDRVLLGDLHAKQGRHKEALDVYAKAAEMLENYVNNTWHWDKDQIKASRELYGKLIQAYLAVGDNEGAKKTMEKIEKIPAPRATANLPSGLTAPPAQASTPTALPGKLIVTATKRQLDQVASGTMTFEDFKKAVKVHRQPAGP
jgi:hypothetical protein